MKPHYTNTANPVDFPKVERKMNKLIDELAEQCYVKTGSVHTDHFAYWKFAELIVRECIKNIRDNMEHARVWTDGDPDLFLETLRKSGHFYITELEQHFGVE